MSLAGAIADAGKNAVDTHAEAWLDKALASAHDAVAERQAELDALELGRPLGTTAGATATMERMGLTLAPAGLLAIESRKPALLRWGRYRAAAVLMQLGAGREVEARHLAMASGLTLEEYLAVSDASSARTGSVTMQRQKDTDEVVAIVREVGIGALRAAIPFILAAL